MSHFSRKLFLRQTPAKYSCLILVIVAILLLTHCTPPKNWKGSAYIRSDKKAASDIDLGQRGGDKLIRVNIHQGAPLAIQLATSNNDEYTFKTNDGQSRHGGGSFTPEQPGQFRAKRNYFKINGIVYKGELKILKRNTDFLYINYVDIDEYLMSVVGHEMSPSWPQQALKAQAVVARTYLYQKMSENKEADFDVESSTNHQVYKGIIKEGRENVQEAVVGTKGEIVTYSGKLASVFYHASAGGKTATAEEVWNKDFPYLRSVTEPYAIGENARPWTHEESLASLKNKLKVNNLKGIRVKSRSSSQRVETVEIQADGKTVVMSGADFRKALGYTQMKSTLFTLKVTGNKLLINGKGYGHGVGMSQWGARYMAEKGRANYKTIIKHFFPGTRIDNS